MYVLTTVSYHLLLLARHFINGHQFVHPFSQALLLTRVAGAPEPLGKYKFLFTQNLAIVRFAELFVQAHEQFGGYPRGHVVVRYKICTTRGCCHSLCLAWLCVYL